MIRLMLVMAAVALAAGCASSGPIAMGNGTYYLTKKSAGCGFSGGEGSKAELMKEANEFCASKGQHADIVTANAKNGVPFARCASAEVTFRCEGGSAQH